MSLIGLSTDVIKELLVRLDTELKSFKKELCRISWHMRGGVSLNDLMFLYSHEDREAMYQVITDNIEITKVTRLPLM